MSWTLPARLRRGGRGFALLLVLWGLILLGLIAASFLRETRVSTTLARNVVENAKAEALADAGVQRAILGLIDSDPVTAWRADGRVYRFAIGEGTIKIKIQDEGGKIDLNHAPAAMLVALFQATGSDPDAAHRFADAVQDYADRDSNRRPAGAEDPDYASAGLKGGAKDAPFERKDELLNVLGINRTIYEAIAPNVTVYSEQGEINRSTAPELVLRTIPDLTPQQLGQIMSARSGGAPLELARVDIVTIIADAATSGGGRFVREAVARRSGQPENPFQILDWRQTWRSALP
jgi:general secretion pathway protein K